MTTFEIQILYVIWVVLNWGVRLGMGLVIVMRRRSPASALAWLGLVAFFPLPGMLLYFLIGENRLGSRDAKRHRAVVERIDRAGPLLQTDDHRIIHPSIPENLISMANLAAGSGGTRPLGGNTVEFLDQTDEFIARLVSDIDRAEYHCHLLYYIFNLDAAGQAVLDALRSAAGRGITCRLLVDAVGSKNFIRSNAWAELRRAGVEVAEALPVNPLRARVARLDLRNHRKLAVFDGSIAYSGSHNISLPIYPKKESFGAWVDATIRLEGPAAVPLQRLFIEDWSLAETAASPETEELLPNITNFLNDDIIAQSLPTGPLSPNAPVQQVILHALHIAKQEVILTTPYFVPDEATVRALVAASSRGVDIVMVVPRRSDNWVTQAAGRSHYGELLDQGVTIQEFTQGLLHAKTLTVDRQFGMIGSANLDLRSFFLNFELSLLIYNTDAASQLRFLQQRYISNSEPLSKLPWRRRAFRYRLGDNLAKLLSPLL